MKTSHLATSLLIFGTCLLTLAVPGFAHSTDPIKTMSKISADIQPIPPCHPNPHAIRDIVTLLTRKDIVHVPDPLSDRLAILAGRPHTYLPLQVFAEADKPSQLFQYYLLDSNGFEPNPFTHQIPGVNDKAMLTATGGDCGLKTKGAVRLALEPKPGLPTDPMTQGRSSTFLPIFRRYLSSTMRAAGTRAG
jgi:hypothetical protein